MWKFLILFLVAVPWYWGWFPDQGRRIIWGMPLWFVVAIFGSLCVSISACSMLSKPWPDELDEEQPQ